MGGEGERGAGGFATDALLNNAVCRNKAQHITFKSYRLCLEISQMFVAACLIDCDSCYLCSVHTLRAHWTRYTHTNACNRTCTHTLSLCLLLSDTHGLSALWVLPKRRSDTLPTQAYLDSWWRASAFSGQAIQVKVVWTKRTFDVNFSVSVSGRIMGKRVISPPWKLAI